jgi:hypothetical protein
MTASKSKPVARLIPVLTWEEAGLMKSYKDVPTIVRDRPQRRHLECQLSK